MVAGKIAVTVAKLATAGSFFSFFEESSKFYKFWIFYSCVLTISSYYKI